MKSLRLLILVSVVAATGCGGGGHSQAWKSGYAAGQELVAGGVADRGGDATTECRNAAGLQTEFGDLSENASNDYIDGCVAGWRARNG